jgi:octaprenyl-diphosphate synthase
VTRQAAGVTLVDIQRPVVEQLDTVTEELGRMVAADLPLMQEVNRHLLRMKGKLFRPTLLLLTHEACATGDARATSLAAIVELIHLATLVHDDSVDHSVLRRGMPTVNTLFSHQVSVIMGDYLYSRAIIELVRLDDLEPMRVLARVTDAMTVGEMRQLAAFDALDFDEREYELLCRSKTASLFAAACEVGALHAGSTQRRAARRYGEALGMAFQITDDLLDYSGNPETTGKDAGRDRDKTTFVNLSGIDGARRLVDELIDASVASLKPFGRRGGMLRALAEYVRGRDR